MSACTDPADLNQLSYDVQNSLRREQEQFPLIGPPVAFAATSIAEATKWNPLLVTKAAYLFEPAPSIAAAGESSGSGSVRYTSVREVRRDGNCFIRAVLFRLLELQLQRPDLAAMSIAFVTGIAPALCHTFSEYVLDFCDVYRELVEGVQSGKIATTSDLHAAVCNPDTSEYLVCFFRYVISWYIRQHAEIFSPYIVDFSSVAEYCSSEVEAVSKECEQVHVTALCNAMNLPIIVQYLDLSPGDKPDAHAMDPVPMDEADVLPERAIPDGLAVHLLYRPGHFDVLYPAV